MPGRVWRPAPASAGDVHPRRHGRPPGTPGRASSRPTAAAAVIALAAERPCAVALLRRTGSTDARPSARRGTSTGQSTGSARARSPTRRPSSLAFGSRLGGQRTSHLAVTAGRRRRVAVAAARRGRRADLSFRVGARHGAPSASGSAACPRARRGRRHGTAPGGPGAQGLLRPTGAPSPGSAHCPARSPPHGPGGRPQVSLTLASQPTGSLASRDATAPLRSPGDRGRAHVAAPTPQPRTRRISRELAAAARTLTLPPLRRRTGTSYTLSAVEPRWWDGMSGRTPTPTQGRRGVRRPRTNSVSSSSCTRTQRGLGVARLSSRRRPLAHARGALCRAEGTGRRTARRHASRAAAAPGRSPRPSMAGRDEARPR